MRIPGADIKVQWMIRKEIREVFRSRWLILGFIISPMFAWMFQGAFLSFIVAQTTTESEQVFITVEDDGEWGRKLYEAIDGNKSSPALLIDPLVNVTRAQGENMIAEKTLSVWVWIPENFTQDLLSTNQTTMIVWVNTANFRATAAAARIDNFARSYINEIVIVRNLSVNWYTIAPEANYGHQLAIFLVMLTSVLAPAPYISKSFAGEREASVFL